MYLQKVLAATAAVLAAAIAPTIQAQTPFPSKPVTIVVANAAGSQADLLARVVGQEMSKQIGQPVIIDNRPGASGFIAAEYSGRAPADGYTLMLGSSGVMVITPQVYAKLPYDALKDFTTVGDVASSPNVIVTSGEGGPTKLDALLARAKASDGITFGSLGSGSVSNIASQMLGASGKVSVMQVPYKSEPQVITDIIAKRLDFGILPLSSTMPFIKTGRLTALAVTSKTRSKYLPGIPTTAELGHPSVGVTQWFGVFAPAATPKDVVTKLSAGLAAALHSPEALRRMDDLAVEPGRMSREEFSKFFHDQFAQYARTVKDLKISIE